MNNIVDMVKYYLVHKNADDSIVSYLKDKLNQTKINDLIIIQIELLYTDPTDKLVTNLVSYINNKINIMLSDIKLFQLVNLICELKYNIEKNKEKILRLESENKNAFDKIKTKDLNNDNIFDKKDNIIAAELINQTQNNIFLINKLNSENNSINIWLKNLENSFNKMINNSNLECLLENYISLLALINRDDNINNYISFVANTIDKKIFKNNLIESIVNIIPELDRLYNLNSNKKNKLYKLLDYYIDVLDSDIKNSISNLEYEERLLLREKLETICYDILHNDIDSDDFKVQVINSYFKYL